MPYVMSGIEISVMRNPGVTVLRKQNEEASGFIGDLVNAFIEKIANMQHIGNVLFNDALNTFYLRLYGFGHIMVKYHSDSLIGNPLSPHGLLFAINSKGSFILCTIPQT